MTRNTKIAIGGGVAALALLLWWLTHRKTAGADVGVSVTKTSSECDPSAANYDASKCTASSDNFTPSLPDKTKEPEQSPAPVDPSTSTPSSSSPDPLWPRSLPGTDGPITPKLQILANAGSRIQDPLVGKLTSSRRG